MDYRQAEYHEELEKVQDRDFTIAGFLHQPLFFIVCILSCRLSCLVVVINFIQNVLRTLHLKMCMCRRALCILPSTMHLLNNNIKFFVAIGSIPIFATLQSSYKCRSSSPDSYRDGRASRYKWDQGRSGRFEVKEEIID